ncbi:MAG: hypothetical protein M1484_02755 [Patescibacteria group bacterium]|nr:hypothetical protein [Patescibacteria group bacterium]MCL5432001.1 hypothetical protein [Patescibacteria group bacterium]
MIKETKVAPEGLLKIKRILDTIQSRYSLNPESKFFEFELGGFGLELKNDTDYSELRDILNGLKTKAGIEHEIADSYIDHRGRKQSYTLYDSQKCRIEITDPAKFMNYHKEINEQCRSTAPKEGAKESDKKAFLPINIGQIFAGLKKDKPKFPYKLPAGTRWEDTTIKFEDDENIYIQVKHLKHHTNYKEMEFVGRGKNPGPSELWTFLKVLAQVNGELAVKDKQARDKYKKQKELLAKALQSYFSIDYDPFFPYRNSFEKYGNSYKIKITLIPPTKTKEPETEEEKDDLGVKEYLDEQSPNVYEKEKRN